METSQTLSRIGAALAVISLICLFGSAAISVGVIALSSAVGDWLLTGFFFTCVPGLLCIALSDDDEMDPDPFWEE